MGKRRSREEVEAEAGGRRGWGERAKSGVLTTPLCVFEGIVESTKAKRMFCAYVNVHTGRLLPGFLYDPSRDSYVRNVSKSAVQESLPLEVRGTPFILCPINLF